MIKPTKQVKCWWILVGSITICFLYLALVSWCNLCLVGGLPKRLLAAWMCVWIGPQYSLIQACFKMYCHLTSSRSYYKYQPHVRLWLGYCVKIFLKWQRQWANTIPVDLLWSRFEKNRNRKIENKVLVHTIFINFGDISHVGCLQIPCSIKWCSSVYILAKPNTQVMGSSGICKLIHGTLVLELVYCFFHRPFIIKAMWSGPNICIVWLMIYVDLTFCTSAWNSAAGNPGFFLNGVFWQNCCYTKQKQVITFYFDHITDTFHI